MSSTTAIMPYTSPPGLRSGSRWKLTKSSSDLWRSETCISLTLNGSPVWYTRSRMPGSGVSATSGKASRYAMPTGSKPTIST